jgi:hypothetical protein
LATARARSGPGPGLLAAFDGANDQHHMDISGNPSGEGCEPFVAFFRAVRVSLITLAFDAVL